MQDPSLICNLYHSSQQRWILNPLSKARDWTYILMDTSQVHYHWAMRETPQIFILEQSAWLPCTRWKREGRNEGRENHGADTAEDLGWDHVDLGGMEKREWLEKRSSVPPPTPGMTAWEIHWVLIDPILFFFLKHSYFSLRSEFALCGKATVVDHTMHSNQWNYGQKWCKLFPGLVWTHPTPPSSLPVGWFYKMERAWIPESPLGGESQG